MPCHTTLLPTCVPPLTLPATRGSADGSVSNSVTGAGVNSVFEAVTVQVVVVLRLKVVGEHVVDRGNGPSRRTVEIGSTRTRLPPDSRSTNHASGV